MLPPALCFLHHGMLKPRAIWKFFRHCFRGRALHGAVPVLYLGHVRGLDHDLCFERTWVAIVRSWYESYVAL